MSHLPYPSAVPDCKSMSQNKTAILCLMADIVFKMQCKIALYQNVAV
jgi:hypothetical protein